MRVVGAGHHVWTQPVAEQLQPFLSVGSEKLHSPAWGLWAQPCWERGKG